MADDALTEADREALQDWWDSGDDFVTEWGLPGLLDAVERIVRARMAQAWDEGANAAVEPFNTGTRMTLRARIPFPADDNPYRDEEPTA